MTNLLRICSREEQILISYESTAEACLEAILSYQLKNHKGCRIRCLLLSASDMTESYMKYEIFRKRESRSLVNGWVGKMDRLCFV